MPGLKIICIGSPFGDDQFGAWAYEELSRLIDSDAAELVYLDRPGTRLISALDGVDKAILVDAVKSGAAIGSVRRIEGAAIYAHLPRPISSHGVGVADALTLAERLGLLPRELVLLGVEAGETGALAPLATPLRASLPALLQALRDVTGLVLLQSHQHEV